MAAIKILDFVTAAGIAGGKPQPVHSDMRLPQDIADQVVAALEGWGGQATAGFATPAVTSFPLEGTKSMKAGALYAVTVTWFGQEIRHRCFLVPSSDYAAYGYHPYRFLVESGQRATLPMVYPFPGEETGPAPATQSSALVVDGLQQLLVRGQLHLPLGAPDPAADHILALMVTAMPQRARSGLRFSSFSPIEPLGLNLAVFLRPGGSLVDWKRRVLNLDDVGLGAEATAYLRAVNDCLATGEVGRLESLACRATFNFVLHGATRITTTTPPRRLAPMVSPPPMATGPGSRPGLEPPTQTESAGPLSRYRGPRLVLERRKIRNITLVESRRTRKLPRSVVAAILVLSVAVVGWRTGFLPGISLSEWKQRVFHESPTEVRSPDSAPLLSVVGVARSYEDILVEYRTAVRVHGHDSAQVRTVAIAELKNRAAIPLARQITTYQAVVQKGIQQSGQPAREVRRLEALTRQGSDLDHDLTRLALAWYSLTTGTCWGDLGRISDDMVSARGDSLRESHARFSRDAAEALGIEGMPDHLRKAAIQAEAMSQLVAMFQAKSWTETWQQEMLTAANRVSPAASPITRAYRNCAFALDRLMVAEHDSASLQVPFSQGWATGNWPSAAVRAQLPPLRRMAGMFEQGKAPPIVEGTVEIYALLQDIRAAAVRSALEPDFWFRLHANPAVAFDPLVFEDVLGRLRFEALRSYLDRGDLSQTWPGHLTTQAGAQSIAEFYRVLAFQRNPEIWRAYADEIPEAFLARWARRLAANYDAAARGELVAFTAACDEVTRDCRRVCFLAEGDRDWTAAWLDLHTAVLDLLDRYVLAFHDNPICRAQVAMAGNLLATMSRPLAVPIAGVAVHLTDDPGQAPLSLELEVQPGHAVFSCVLPAPEAVAAGQDLDRRLALDWTLAVEPQQWIRIRVRNQTTGEILFEQVCPSLLERVGMAGLTRTLHAPGAAITFSVSPGAWRQLVLPDLTTIFSPGLPKLGT